MSLLYLRFSGAVAPLALMCVLGHPSADAAGNVQSSIATVRVDSDGKGIVKFSQVIGGTPPGCVAQGFNAMMSFNANTTGGRAILAAALAAKATSSTVLAVGVGTCMLYANTIEDLGYLEQL